MILRVDEQREALSMDPLGQTSRWMAAVRASESQRPDHLFDDPLAVALAGPEGFGWMSRMELAQLWGGPALYVDIRTRSFDDSSERATCSSSRLRGDATM